MDIFWSEQILAIDGKTDFKSEIYGYETKKLHKRKTSREIVNLISSEEKKKFKTCFWLWEKLTICELMVALMGITSI